MMALGEVTEATAELRRAAEDQPYDVGAAWDDPRSFKAFASDDRSLVKLNSLKASIGTGGRINLRDLPQIIHHEGKSSEQVVAARHIRFQTSKVRYFRKFHGPLQAEALRVFILASFAVEWLFEAGKWLLGSRRPLRCERMAAYGQLLRS